MEQEQLLCKIVLLMNVVVCAALHGLNIAAIPNKIMDEVYPEDLQITDELKHHEDADLDASALIDKYGYECETHEVTTSDGYILTMHRIPGPKSNAQPDGKKVVFLMHGLVESSVDFIIIGPGKALAYILSDKGYDVWMGNARGNHYSRKHQQYSDVDKEFWMFSWHEIGVEDVPTMIDYVREKTEQDKIFYVGHSQGTTAFFVMASERPEYNDKITAMFALAPVAFTGHATSPLFVALARIDNVLYNTLALIGVYEFNPTDGFVEDVAVIACGTVILTDPVCKNIIYLIGGYGTNQLNSSTLPVILGHFPAGASTRQFVHYFQLMKSKKFRQYDYGTTENNLRYNRKTPPSYRLSNVTVPVILFYGLNDLLSDVKDVNKLESKLPNVYAKLKVPYSKFAHFDFVWGKDAYRMVYSKIINMMDNFEDIDDDN